MDGMDGLLGQPVNAMSPFLGPYKSERNDDMGMLNYDQFSPFDSQPAADALSGMMNAGDPNLFNYMNDMSASNPQNVHLEPGMNAPMIDAPVPLDLDAQMNGFLSNNMDNFASDLGMNPHQPNMNFPLGPEGMAPMSGLPAGMPNNGLNMAANGHGMPVNRSMTATRMGLMNNEMYSQNQNLNSMGIPPHHSLSPPNSARSGNQLEMPGNMPLPPPPRGNGRAKMANGLTTPTTPSMSHLPSQMNGMSPRMGPLPSGMPPVAQNLANNFSMRGSVGTADLNQRRPSMFPPYGTGNMGGNPSVGSLVGNSAGTSVSNAMGNPPPVGNLEAPMHYGPAPPYNQRRQNPNMASHNLGNQSMTNQNLGNQNLGNQNMANHNQNMANQPSGMAPPGFGAPNYPSDRYNPQFGHPPPSTMPGMPAQPPSRAEPRKRAPRGQGKKAQRAKIEQTSPVMENSTQKPGNRENLPANAGRNAPYKRKAPMEDRGSPGGIASSINGGGGPQPVGAPLNAGAGPGESGIGMPEISPLSPHETGKPDLNRPYNSNQKQSLMNAQPNKAASVNQLKTGVGPPHFGNPPPAGHLDPSIAARNASFSLPNSSNLPPARQNSHDLAGTAPAGTQAPTPGPHNLPGAVNDANHSHAEPRMQQRQFQFSSQHPPPPRTVQALRSRVQLMLLLNQELLKIGITTPQSSHVFPAVMDRLEGNLRYLKKVYGQQLNTAAVLALPPPLLHPIPEAPNLNALYERLVEMFRFTPTGSTPAPN